MTDARHSRLLAASAAVLGAVAIAVTSAGAAPASVDVLVDVGVGRTAREARPVPNGGTATVTGLVFWAGPGLELITPEAASADVRFDLPEGLRWGRDEPDPTEQCTGTPSSGLCHADLEPISGRSGVGWAWEIVAARAGTYVLRAETVTTSVPDPDLSNNRTSVTVVVTESAPPAPPATPGPVRAGAIRLSPGRPKAGSVVVASVRMTAGSAPVRPSEVTCAGTAGVTKLRGTGRAGNGSATCTYRTPRRATGKVLRGAVTFIVLGERYTRRFSARLR